MQKENLTYLENLLNAASPTGYETKARELWRKEMKTITSKVHGDTHGNSYAMLKGSGNKHRVMIAGHIDEIGFQVKWIDSEGYIKFQPIGGFDTQIVPGRRVLIHTKDGCVKGVIGKKAIHLMKPEDRKNIPEFSDLWIDIGLNSDKKVKKLVNVGDYVTYVDGFEKLSDDVCIARGVDDKIGAYIAGEVLRYIKGKKFAADVYAVATVQEEIGIRGAKTGAGKINPTVAFAIDVDHANMPDVGDSITGGVKIGKGPVINCGANFNSKLFELISATAKKKKIPVQIKAQAGGTGTDANAIQLHGDGVPVALVSIPNRYMHTPVELFSLSDVKNAIAIISETILALTEKDDFII